MNEWPENFAGLDRNWNLIDTTGRIFKTTLLGAVLLAGIGLAQASELPTVLVTETAGWVDFSGWFADGAVGGFDAAGASVGG